MEEDRGMWNEEGREEERGYMERCGEWGIHNGV